MKMSLDRVSRYLLISFLGVLFLGSIGVAPVFAKDQSAATQLQFKIFDGTAFNGYIQVICNATPQSDTNYAKDGQAWCDSMYSQTRSDGSSTGSRWPATSPIVFYGQYPLANDNVIHGWTDVMTFTYMSNSGKSSASVPITFRYDTNGSQIDPSNSVVVFNNPDASTTTSDSSPTAGAGTSSGTKPAAGSSSTTPAAGSGATPKPATTTPVVSSFAPTAAAALSANEFSNITNAVDCRLKIDPTCSSIPTIIQAAIKWMISIAGTAFLFMFLIGGLQYLTAAGNDGQTTKSKNTMIFAIVGMLIMLVAWAVITFIVSALT